MDQLSWILISITYFLLKKIYFMYSLIGSALKPDLFYDIDCLVQQIIGSPWHAVVHPNDTVPS